MQIMPIIRPPSIRDSYSCSDSAKLLSGTKKNLVRIGSGGNRWERWATAPAKVLGGTNCIGAVAFGSLRLELVMAGWLLAIESVLVYGSQNVERLRIVQYVSGRLKYSKGALHTVCVAVVVQFAWCPIPQAAGQMKQGCLVIS